MKYDYKEEYLGNAKGQVTITIPAEEMMSEYNKQIEEIKKDAVVPGFRKVMCLLRLLKQNIANTFGVMPAIIWQDMLSVRYS